MQPQPNCYVGIDWGRTRREVCVLEYSAGAHRGLMSALGALMQVVTAQNMGLIVPAAQALNAVWPNDVVSTLPNKLPVWRKWSINLQNQSVSAEYPSPVKRG